MMFGQIFVIVFLNERRLEYSLIHRNKSLLDNSIKQNKVERETANSVRLGLDQLKKGKKWRECP